MKGRVSCLDLVGVGVHGVEAQPYHLHSEGPIAFCGQVEIPNFIQRDDFIDQLYRWSMNTGEEAVGRSLGMPFKCEPIYIYGEEDEQTLWGWTIAFVKDGDVMCTLFCGFDEDTSKKYRWMGRNLDTGMPEFEGDFEEIAGKNFEIW